jgi:hypothetical protein
VAQPAHALNLADLVGDTLFELLVEFGDFLRADFELFGSLALFFQQAGVLDGYNCLGREILQQSDLLISERTNLFAEDCNSADQLLIFEHRDGSYCPHAAKLRSSNKNRIALGVKSMCRYVGNLGEFLALCDAA